MRMKHLSIVAPGAQNHGKYWRNLLRYLQLRGVCSG